MDSEGIARTILLKFERKTPGQEKNKTKQTNQQNRTGKLKIPAAPGRKGRWRGNKNMPFKLVMEVRRTRKSPRASGKACLGVLSSRSRPEGTQLHAFKSQSKGVSSYKIFYI